MRRAGPTAARAGELTSGAGPAGAGRCGAAQPSRQASKGARAGPTLLVLVVVLVRVLVFVRVRVRDGRIRARARLTRTCTCTCTRWLLDIRYQCTADSCL